MMLKSENLDERQLLMRGNIFRHGLFMLCALLLINAALYQIGIDWAADKWAELTIVLFTITFCSIEFIFRDIYPLKRKNQIYWIYFLGVFGIVSISLCLFEMMTERTGFIDDGKVSADGLGIIFGIMFLSVTIAHLIKSYINRMNEDEV